MSDSENEEEQEPYEILYQGEENKRPYVYRDGIAKAQFPNEDTYEGEYKNFQRSGNGEYNWNKTGAKYVGEWKEGKKHGFGTQIYPDKSSYTGEWFENARHGQGTYTYPNGDRYCGNWEHDVKQGTGTYLYSSSQTQLHGQWIKGKCPNGVWSFIDKNLFEANVKNNNVISYNMST